MVDDDSEKRDLPAEPGKGESITFMQFLLIPLCFVGAFWLPIEATTSQRIKIASLVWLHLTCGSVILTSMVSDVRRVVGFFVGPKTFRRIWLRAQIKAWLMTIAYFLLMVTFFCAYDGRRMTDSIAFAGVGAVSAAIGFYVLAMQNMPQEFFETGVGMSMYHFLGRPSYERLPRACVLGCLGFIILALVLAFIPYHQFPNNP